MFASWLLLFACLPDFVQCGNRSHYWYGTLPHVVLVFWLAKVPVLKVIMEQSLKSLQVKSTWFCTTALFSSDSKADYPSSVLKKLSVEHQKILHIGKYTVKKKPTEYKACAIF